MPALVDTFDPKGKPPNEKRGGERGSHGLKQCRKFVWFDGDFMQDGSNQRAR
jgi:hypothetical protein